MVSSMCDSGEISPSEVAKPATDGGVIVPGAWWIITVFLRQNRERLLLLFALKACSNDDDVPRLHCTRTTPVGTYE